MFIAELFIDEAPLPPEWDPQQFKQGQSTFKGRLAYALERAKKLGTGSSRVAMIIEYEGRPTVLKVAKNGKGVHQNSAEVDVMADGYASQLGILIPFIDYDRENSQPLWIQTEMAKKTNETQLCQLMKCRSLMELVTMSNAILGLDKYNKPNDITSSMSLVSNYSDEDIDIFTDYANKIAELKSSFSVQTGDLARAVNWGIYQGRPVIIDSGLTEWVYDTFYRPKPKPKAY